MSLLYNNKEDRTYSVIISKDGSSINLLFTSNCGKFGTDEILDEYDLTPIDLLDILQKHFDNE